MSVAGRLAYKLCAPRPSPSGGGCRLGMASISALAGLHPFAAVAVSVAVNCSRGALMARPRLLDLFCGAGGAFHCYLRPLVPDLFPALNLWIAGEAVADRPVIVHWRLSRLLDTRGSIIDA